MRLHIFKKLPYWEKDQIRLRKPWVGHVFHSNFHSTTRGTAILIHKKNQFNVTSIISNPQGHFIVVSGLLFLKPVVLVNVYAPNWDDDKFIGNTVSSAAWQIRKPNNELTIDPGEIKEIFNSFYLNLYTSEMPNECSDMENFFKDLQAPFITAMHWSKTELPLQQAEIMDAISAM